MKSGKRWVAVIVLLAAGALVAGWVVALRSQPDRRALLALLPPGADAYVLLDLAALQSNPFVKSLLADPPDFSPTVEYQQLLRQTGFRYQDDLKQLAAARLGDNWVGAATVDLDRARFIGYLESQGAVQSSQGGHVAYSFGSVRPFRLAFLDDQLVGFSIGPDPSLLAGVLDRSAQRASENAAEDLRRGGDFNTFLSARGLTIFARIDRLLETHPEGARVGAFQFGKEWLEGSKTMVAQVDSSPLTLGIHLDDRCDNAASATRIAGGFQTVLAILRAVPSGEASSQDRDRAVLLSALSIRQQGASVLLDWSANAGMLVALLGNPK